MGKNNRHQKNIKSEKAKVKLKTKKTSKPLPKGLNVTDTTFKVKKIIIREQLKQHEETEILSRRKLNVKELLTRLQHHNSTVRQEAVRELKEILSQHSTEILSSQLRSLLQERLANFSNSEVTALPQLIKILRVIFLRASKVFYKSGLSLGETLSSVIEAHARGPRRELQSQLFGILSEIVLNHELKELHNEKAFRNFVTSLPSLLLKNSIYENTIEMLNRVVLQYGSWIRDELVSKHEAIINNARKIDIIGSEDEKRSRLMICNLLYFNFVNEEIYY